jgi:hypothetical protein
LGQPGLLTALKFDGALLDELGRGAAHRMFLGSFLFVFLTPPSPARPYVFEPFAELSVETPDRPSWEYRGVGAGGSR